MQEVHVEAETYMLSCQDEFVNGTAAYAINSDWNKQAASEIGRIKARGEVRV
jgi:hypothetical protein